MLVFVLARGEKSPPLIPHILKHFIKTIKFDMTELWEYRTIDTIQEGFPALMRICTMKNDYNPYWGTNLRGSLKR
jgi:hypothetical protein